MRIILLVAGLVAFCAGLFWAAQGLGWIMWPESSFMLADRKWTWIGGATALVGLALVVQSRRR